MWSAGRTMCSAKPKLNVSSSVVTFKIQSADDPECRMEKASEFTCCSEGNTQASRCVLIQVWVKRRRKHVPTVGLGLFVFAHDQKKEPTVSYNESKNKYSITIDPLLTPLLHTEVIQQWCHYKLTESLSHTFRDTISSCFLKLRQRGNRFFHLALYSVSASVVSAIRSRLRLDSFDWGRTSSLTLFEASPLHTDKSGSK